MDGENLLPVFTWKGCLLVTDSGRRVLDMFWVLRDLFLIHSRVPAHVDPGKNHG